MAEFDKLRGGIDAIDSRILQLLNKRTGVVLKIRKAKKDKRLSPHSPEREREIMGRLVTWTLSQ